MNMEAVALKKLILDWQQHMCYYRECGKGITQKNPPEVLKWKIYTYFSDPKSLIARDVFCFLCVLLAMYFSHCIQYWNTILNAWIETHFFWLLCQQEKILEMGEARNRKGPITSQVWDLPNCTLVAGIPIWCSCRRLEITVETVWCNTFIFELYSKENFLPCTLLPQQGKYRPPREASLHFPEAVVICACRR